MVSQKTLQSEDLIFNTRTDLVQSFQNTSSGRGHNFRVSIFCFFGWFDTWFLWWSDRSDDWFLGWSDRSDDWFLWWSDRSDDWFLWWSDRSDDWFLSWVFTTAWPRIVFDLMSFLPKTTIAAPVPFRAKAIRAYSVELAASCTD
jgi:hypothetical protein